MTPTFSRLQHAVMVDHAFANIVNDSMCSIRHRVTKAPDELVILAERLSGMYGLSAEVHHNALVLWNAQSRAAQPACIVVSMDAGQAVSPSARSFRRCGYALMQVFEGGADDTELAGDSPRATHRIETKGRMLFN